LTATLTPTITYTPTITNTPTFTFTPQPTLPAITFDCVPRNTTRESATVVGIVDGDTIDVRINDQIYRVRYIGIDTPERDEFFYNQASVHNQQLVFGKTVTLVKDVSETDAFDRLLRYVLIENIFVNHEIVAKGYAYAATYPPDVLCSQVFINAQKSAEQGKIGLWMPTPTFYIPPPTEQNQGGSGNCHPSYPGVCIPPSPPDLNCADVPYRDFRVVPPDPHNLDGDSDGIGCET
jgi:micrococcal nuclease